MKKIVFILFLVGLAGNIPRVDAGSDEIENGKVIFEKRGCGACHDPATDQSVLGLGPSVQQICEAYKGHEGDLSKFLKCESKPRVDPARFSTMHEQIVKVKGMSAPELEALQKFLCHK